MPGQAQKNIGVEVIFFGGKKYSLKKVWLAVDFAF
jgi:hypothetical protein